MQTVQAENVWHSRETFSPCTWKRVTVSDDGVRLRRGVTLADEMGRCNDRDRERVAGRRQAKKVLDLPALNATRAVLCPYLDCAQEGGELEILVNGHPIRLVWRKDRPYWEDRWTPVEVPCAYLRPGENEVVFRAVGDAEWRLLLEEGKYPNLSAVSEDGGQTWRFEDLGERNGSDGEYLVRLWLDQYAATGEVCSEPVDLLRLGQPGGIAARGRVRKTAISTSWERPEGSTTAVFWRGGPTPAYRPETWTAWQPACGEIVPEACVRFVQWRAVLTTEDVAVTPVLRDVRLQAEVDAESIPVARVAAADNPNQVRSSYRFTSLPANAPRAAVLSERWRLKDVVRPARSEFEAFLHLRQWVRAQWEDGWNMGGIDFCPPWDAMVILELASRKLSLGMCTHYATVMSHCCAALGLTARTQIMHSHCINEVWSSEHGKWVAMDVGGDQDDETKFTYHFERNGVPLSALEAHRAWVAQDYDDVVLSPQPPPATRGRFAVEKRLRLFDRFMISLRNDELASMAPGEPEHGKGSYHYDGYLFWQDDETEPLPWFSNHTDREGDLYWTVNRVTMHLQEGETPGQLQVLLETETPDVAGFEAREGDGDWAPREAAFAWYLCSGENRLEVRPVNGAGRRGASSWVTVWS